MAVNVGGIYFSVEAETKNATLSIKNIQESIKLMADNGAANLSKLTNAFKPVESASNKLNETFNRNAKYSTQTLSGLENRLERLQSALNKSQIGSEGFNKLSAAIQDTKNKIDSAGQSGSKLQGLLNGLGASFATMGIMSLGNSVLTTAGTFEKYNAVLRNTLGTQEEATKSMQLIEDFASSTPFSVDELTSSFIKFANRGLKLTREELEAFGDTAASQGKSFDQYTEAVLDALSGETERLKEFGIKSSKSGDQISFTFKGITKTVKNSEQEIKGALLEIGKMEGVKGGMKAIAETWEGAVSNMGDSIDSLKKNIGNALLPLAKQVVIAISSIVNYVSNFAKENKALFNTIVMVSAGIATIVTGIMAVQAAAVLLAPLFIAAKAAIVAIGVFLAANPIGLAIIAIGISILAVITYWDELTAAIFKTADAFDSMVNEIVALFQPLTNEVTAFFDSFGESESAWDSIIEGNKQIGEAVQKVVTWFKENVTVLNVIKASLAPIVIAINIIVAAVRLFVAAWDLTLKAIDAVSRRLQPMKDLVSTIVKSIKDLISGNISLNIDLPNFTETLKNAFDLAAIYNYFQKGFAEIWNDIKKMATQFWDSFKTISRNAINAIKDFFKNDKTLEKELEKKDITIKPKVKIEKIEMPKDGKAGKGEKAEFEISDAEKAFSKEWKNSKKKSFDLDFGDLYSQLKSLDDRMKEFDKAISSAGSGFEKLALQVGKFAMIAQDMLKNIGGGFVNMLAANAQLASAKFDNLKQKLGFINELSNKFIEDGLKNQINAINFETNVRLKEFDEQLKQIEDQKEAELQLEKDFQEEMKALKLQLDEESKAEAQRKFEEAWKTREQDYENQLEFIRKNTEDETERAISEETLLNEKEQEKISLRQTINEQLAADLELNEQTIADKQALFDEQKAIREEAAGKKKQTIEQQKTAFLAEQENKRTQAQDAADKQRNENQKQARLVEWAMGRGAFEANKRMQVAQVQIQLASVMMSAVQAMAGMSAATLGFGTPFALALMGMIMGMGIASSSTSLAAINTAQYPPPPVFEKGGMVGGNSHSMGGTMIEAEAGEFVVNKNSTAANMDMLQAINSGQSVSSNKSTNVYYAGVQIGTIQSNNPDEIYRMVEPRIRQEIYQAVTR